MPDSDDRAPDSTCRTIAGPSVPDDRSRAQDRLWTCPLAGQRHLHMFRVPA